MTLRQEGRNVHRTLRHVLLLSIVGAIAATIVSAASATHDGRRPQWFFGPAYTSPGFNVSGPYDSQTCGDKHFNSEAEFSGYGWTTVAIIDGSGGWNVSARSENDLAIWINPDTLEHASSFNKKAYCGNSGSGEQVTYLQCSRAFWVNPYHVSCA